MCLTMSFRSTSSSNVHGQLMTQSMYVPSRRSADRDSIDEGGRFSSASATRHHPVSSSGKSNKRSTSVYGLDKSGKEGNEGRVFCTKANSQKHTKMNIITSFMSTAASSSSYSAS